MDNTTRIALARHLKALEKPDGGLSEKDVIDDARNKDSPLHPFFEWNNGKAAEAYRLVQARQLIRTVRLVVTVHRIDVSIPAYVKDGKRGAGYRDIIKVRDEVEQARDTFVSELMRVKSAIRRAKAVAIGLGLTDEIEVIDQLVAGLCRQVSIDDTPAAEAA